MPDSNPLKRQSFILQGQVHIEDTNSASDTSDPLPDTPPPQIEIPDEPTTTQIYLQ